MRWQAAFLLVALMGVPSLSGCANARYLQVDQNTGVVAMPANTNCWPTYYRDHAEALIRQQCPGGYEVVHEEESVVGQVAHTHTDSETRPPPTVNLGGVVGVAVPLGNTEERTRETTNFENVTEWRIYYRAKQPGPPAPRS
jgi:hypothetical protein